MSNTMRGAAIGMLAIGAGAPAPQASAGGIPTEAPEQVEQAKADIWAKELAIYAGRGRGDLRPYIESTAPGYMAWPPQSATPVTVGDLRRSAAMPSKEKLTMELVDFTLSDNTAIVYYRTHRTVRPDGAPTDESFETTHTWVRGSGGWQILGGMARPRPDRP